MIFKRAHNALQGVYPKRKWVFPASDVDCQKVFVEGEAVKLEKLQQDLGFIRFERRLGNLNLVQLSQKLDLSPVMVAELLALLLVLNEPFFFGQSLQRGQDPLELHEGEQHQVQGVRV